MLSKFEKIKIAVLSEVEPKFWQMMADRMAVSFCKYGAVKQNAPHPKLLDNVIVRMEKYKETGNTEFLVDAANFCMIEFMFPSHKEAHFRATDSDEAPPLASPLGLKFRYKRDGD